MLTTVNCYYIYPKPPPAKPILGRKLCVFCGTVAENAFLRGVCGDPCRPEKMGRQFRVFRRFCQKRGGSENGLRAPRPKIPFLVRKRAPAGGFAWAGCGKVRFLAFRVGRPAQRGLFAVFALSAALPAVVKRHFRIWGHPEMRFSLRQKAVPKIGLPEMAVLPAPRAPRARCTFPEGVLACAKTLPVRLPCPCSGHPSPKVIFYLRETARLAKKRWGQKS